MPIALYAYFEADNVTFNANDVRSINVNSEDAQIDASGFSTTGLDNTLAGTRARSIEVEFFTKRTAGAMAQVLFPLHDGRTTFQIKYRADMNASTSSTNPQWSGDVILPVWNESVTRGDVETTTLTFVSTGTSGLARYYT